MTKNLRDIQGPALAIVIERLKPFGAPQGVFQFPDKGIFIFLFSLSIILSWNCLLVGIQTHLNQE